jgi:hypothetical protein
MQQAKHMADAAVAALAKVGSGLSYDETSPQDITGGILLRCNGNPINCDVAHDFAERADSLLKSAEAQLAAVREIINDIPESVFTAAEVGMLDEGDAIEAVGDLRIIRALLTPAPSHGAGEKT